MALILAIAGCGTFVLALANGMCRNEIFQEVFSPNSEYKAVVFSKVGGATTGYETQISILKASRKLPNTLGNILILDGHPDWTKVKLNWETNRSVSIVYSERFNVFYKKDIVRGSFTLIEIDYKVGPEQIY